MSLAEQKAAMRREARARRRTVREGPVPAAELVVDRYRASSIPTPKVAALYAPQGSEISPEALALYLHEQGARIAAPCVVASDEPLAFLAIDDFPNPEAASLLKPPPGAAAVVPDLIIVPLMAFDDRGYRLGQGGGFYDRTLAALRAGSTSPLAIGLAYASQRVEDVPVDAYDQPLDGVLTEARFHDFRGNRACA